MTNIAKYDKIKQLSIVACLDGEIEDVNFLLNTLILQAEKINYKNVVMELHRNINAIDPAHEVPTEEPQEENTQSSGGCYD